MEFLKKKWRMTLLLVLLGVILFCIFGGYLLSHFHSEGEDVGVQIVRAMYEFDTLEEAEKNVGKLRPVVSDEVWEQITFDNSSRVISTYFKFQASPSKVILRKVEPGVVIYSLECEYILSDRIFVLEYKQTKRQITEIREYELKGHSWGREGVLE